jgi:uncharacterized membrane protein
MGSGALFIAVFLACVVEAVEATTIVLAAGTARDWRSAGLGVGAALAVLAVIVAVLGPAVSEIPLRGLRVVVGALLLIFGVQWVRKAVLRASGHKALHDEEVLYAKHLEEAIGLAAIAAAAAILLVAAAGFAVKAPLARVPENTMKFVVGIMLTSFGMFWGAEGAGAHWPGSDAALLVIIPVVALYALGLAALLRRAGGPGSTTADPAGVPAAPESAAMSRGVH